MSSLCIHHSPITMYPLTQHLAEYKGMLMYSDPSYKNILNILNTKVQCTEVIIALLAILGDLYYIENLKLRDRS